MEREPGCLELRAAQDGPVPLAAELRCRAARLLALVGPSGSGKSTLLRTIAGLYRPRSGHVTVDGEVWWDTRAGIDVPTHRRAAGLVFQSYALFPHLSAQDNVSAALGHLPARARAARARELLALVHLEGLHARRPAGLSGGQQQRVAVARALAREPRVLLLDEPFSAVDKVTREKLYRELALLRERLAMPVVLVTHDLEESLALADRICILHRGSTLQEGSPNEVLERPASARVARLTGNRNVFEARVLEHRAAQGVTVLGWGEQPLECAHRPELARGSRVTWTIPPPRVVLHRRDRPSRGERENPVRGEIDEVVHLGALSVCRLRVDAAPGRPLAFSVATHAARRNALARGVGATVSLLADAIHVMEPRADDDEDS